MKRNEFQKQTRQALVARRDALRRTLAGDAAVLRGTEDTGVGDEIDAAIETEQAEMRSQMASFESRELTQIDAALEKLKSGSYGFCDNCEQPISPLRLQALPYATECIACARRGERRGTAPSRGPVNRIAAYPTDDNEPLLGEAIESLEEIG